jgi:hypothetical protein
MSEVRWGWASSKGSRLRFVLGDQWPPFAAVLERWG